MFTITVGTFVRFPDLTIRLVTGIKRESAFSPAEVRLISMDGFTVMHTAEELIGAVEADEHDAIAFRKVARSAAGSVSLHALV